MNAVAREYLEIMQGFLDQSLSPAAFQNLYLAKFKSETRTMNEQTFQILDKVFGDLDAFTTDDLLRERVNKETRRWSPELAQLRSSVESAVRALGGNEIN